MTWFKNRHEEQEEDDEQTQGPQENGQGKIIPIPNSLVNGYSHNRFKDTDFDDWEHDWELSMGRFNRTYDYTPRTEKDYESYDFLKDYSKIFNLFPASTPYITPYSNHAIYIIDILSKLGIKFRIDMFPYDNHSFGSYSSSSATDTTSHRLINIIAEPNPEVTGPAIVFSAHHDVANPRSENCQDNGASVCNLLRLASLINKNPQDSQRTVIVFTDCEESGARGATRFAKQLVSDKNNKDKQIIEHKIFGEISGVIILELTGHGGVIWTDCAGKPKDRILHNRLEKAAKKQLPKVTTPPSDVLTFRSNDYPALCIGTLKATDMQQKSTWSLCHRMSDTIDGCDEKEMKDFTEFLHEVSKINHPETKSAAQLELELK